MVIEEVSILVSKNNYHMNKNIIDYNIPNIKLSYNKFNKTKTDTLKINYINNQPKDLKNQKAIDTFFNIIEKRLNEHGIKFFVEDTNSLKTIKVSKIFDHTKSARFANSRQELEKFITSRNWNYYSINS